jgi:hypothetical protein
MKELNNKANNLPAEFIEIMQNDFENDFINDIISGFEK